MSQNKLKETYLFSVYLGDTVDEIEKKIISKTLTLVKNKRLVHKILGIGQRTLYRKIDEYKMSRFICRRNRDTMGVAQQKETPKCLPNTSRENSI